MGESSFVIEYMKLLRLWNGAIAALGLFLGAAVAVGVVDLHNHWFALFFGTIIVILFVGAGNSLNDYYDVETDRIAHPSRPLVRGTVDRHLALQSAAVMFALCFLIGIVINPLSLAIVGLAILAMVSYELKLKHAGFAGNLTIALLVAALFEFAGSVVGRADQTLILAVLAGLATLGREIIKDIEDVKGDADRNTLPKIIGIKAAGYVALIPTFMAIVLSPVPFLVNQLSILYLVVVLVADAIFVIGAFLQLEKPALGQKIYKWGMVVALLAFAVGVQA